VIATIHFVSKRDQKHISGSSRLTQPVVHPKIWSEIPQEQVGEAMTLTDRVEDAACDQETQVTQDNQLRILCFVQGTAGIEMVDTASNAVVLANTTALTLNLVLVVAGDIGEEVHWPTKELLADEMNCCGEGGLLSKLIQLVKQVASARAKLLLRLRDKYHVSLHVASGLVVLAVRDFPGEIWYQKRGVAEEANSIVQDFAG
jgi:hypothetical protein